MSLFLRLAVSFAPWVAFLIIAKDNLVRVEIGLVVALALSIVMALLRLHRGIIMWVGLVFFTATTIAVLVLHNIWTARHLGVMATGALALGSWAGLVIGKPFSLAYARQNTDRALWHHPVFIRTNTIVTATWATAFTFNTAIEWLLLEQSVSHRTAYALSYTALIGVAAFTSWYRAHVRRTNQLFLTSSANA
jgi:hypothetical protein